MKKKWIIWAVLCHIGLAVSARNAMEDGRVAVREPDGNRYAAVVRDGDTLSVLTDTSSIMLNEVTVKPRSVGKKEGRRMIYPSEELVKKSTDGMDLLGRLRLPRISVNQLTGEVGMSSGREVCLCINGVRVTNAEIAAVPPSDILRIEYHDSPGARYGNAAAVIDYITKRRDRGGHVNGDFFNGVGAEGASAIDAFSARYSSGKSEWVLGMQYFQVKRSDWIRDYDETRVFPEKILSRYEIGSPVSVNLKSVNSFLNYSCILGGRVFFNVRMNYALNDVPYSEEGDRRTLLFSSEMATPLSVYEHTAERSHSPSLDLYMRYLLPDGGKVVVDVVGTCIKTSAKRIYKESRDDEIVEDVYSDISGHKYSLMTEGFYEKTFGKHSLTSGVKYMQSYINNVYAGTTSTDVALRQSESAAYMEYDWHVGKWGSRVNVTGLRLCYGQEGNRNKRFFMQPSAGISFEPDENSYLKYRVDLTTESPSLSVMNDAEQSIDAGQVRRGNVNLHSFRVFNQMFSAGYGRKFLNVDLAVGYRYERRPVMESVSYENGIFVRMYENQRSFRSLSAEATVTLRPWKEHIVLSVTPEVNRYICSGYGFLHTYTMPRLRWDAEISYGHWMLRYNTLVGYANYVYGEQLMKEKNMHTVMLGYKLSKWSLQLGLLNPFLKEYWMETQEWSSFVPSVSKAHSGHPLQVLMKLNMDLHYGKSMQRERKRIHYEDTDAGIMRGTRK